MIKKIIVAFCFFFSLTTFAQQGSASPYSYYGVGDVKFKGTVESRSMGGISVFPDSIHMNLQNPAHFASLKLTNFSIGGSTANTKMTSEGQSETSRRTSVDYFAAALPFKKFGIGFGAIPYSSVGYKIQQKYPNPKDATVIDSITNYDGTGGVNKVFLGFGYQLTKKINIGADFQYNFGNIQTTSLHTQPVQYNTQELNHSHITGYNLDFGATYQSKINSKLSFFGSLLYTPEAKLSLNNTRNVQIVQLLTNTAQVVIDQQPGAVSDTKIRLPQKLALGTGFGEVKKWLIGAEVTYIQNSVLSNRTPDITGNSYENSMRYSIGGYYIPNYNSYSDYYKKIVYRGGFRFENTGLVIQNQSIQDYAANFGVGLPIGGIFSNANIGLEIGQRGTTYNNLVRENYINLCVGFSLNDVWFRKRKID